MVISLSVLAVGSADLHVVLVSNGLERRLVLAKIGQVDVDGGAETRAAVGRARGDVAQVAVVLEGDFLLDGAGASDQTLEDLEERRALLHGDDAQVVLFVHPDEEGLVVVVVDATGLGPVAVQVAGLQEAVAFFEQEVVFNQLFLGGSVHAVKRVVGSRKLTCHIAEALSDFTFKFSTRLGADTRSKAVVGSVTSNANTGGLDQNLSSNWQSGAVHAISAHLAFVLIIGTVAVIILNNLIHQRSKGRVTAVRTSIDTNARVSVLGTREDSSGEIEAHVIFLACQLLEDFFGAELRER